RFMKDSLSKRSRTQLRIVANGVDINRSPNQWRDFAHFQPFGLGFNFMEGGTECGQQFLLRLFPQFLDAVEPRFDGIQMGNNALLLG
ncbi:hypothetical protein RZS08_57690, partial [Arthrospira platensis SPKY1]|nr:hypothetical protein [Arthrospira platensis SPKY1]